MTDTDTEALRMTAPPSGPNGHVDRTADRSPEQIRAHIDSTRERLVGTVESLSDRLQPSSIAADASAKARGLVYDENGALRVRRVATAAAVVVGLLVVRGLIRSSHKTD